MQIDEEEYRKLRKDAETARREHDEAVGQLNAAKEQLKTSFGCDTLEEAEVLLKKLRKEEKALGEAFEDAVAQFKEAWAERLAV